MAMDLKEFASLARGPEPVPFLSTQLAGPRQVDMLAVLLEGFTGTIKDALGRTYSYVDGRRVASSHPDADAHAWADKRAERIGTLHQRRRDDPRAVVHAARKAAGATHGMRDSDRTEAAAAALLGHDWQHKSEGWDTREKADRWLGDEAKKHGNPTLLWDVKGDAAKEGKKAVGYDDKRLEAARKANDYQATRAKGEKVIPAFVVVHRDGVYLHFGQDPESQGPTFGALDSRSKRKIVAPDEIGDHIDGQGGILPAVRLSSAVVGRNGEGLKNLTADQVREIHENVRTALKSAMSKGKAMQDHFDKQADAAQKRLGKEVGKSEAGVQGTVEANPTGAAKAVAKHPEARKKVLDELAKDDPELAAFLAKRKKK